MPLFYELSVETTYPIAEGATTGTLALLNNIGCLFYLLISLIPGIGKMRAVLSICFEHSGLHTYLINPKCSNFLTNFLSYAYA